jgi:tetrahydromethanopterin S-methyltransferase subunit G
MTRDKTKQLLDFIPLAILTVSAIILLWAVASSNVGLLWRHIVGLIVLAINFLLFWWRHKIGVISLGSTLILGLFGLLSFSPTITTSTFGLGNEDSGITIFYGQVIFLLWLLIHFIVSGRHYVGILTKKYWQNLFNKTVINAS